MKKDTKVFHKERIFARQKEEGRWRVVQEKEGSKKERSRQWSQEQDVTDNDDDDEDEEGGMGDSRAERRSASEMESMEASTSRMYWKALVKETRQ